LTAPLCIIPGSATAYLHVSPRCPNITSIEKRRRHRGEAADGEEKDATPDLLMKHLNETFVTHVEIVETLITYIENTYKTHLKKT
jgi:hypothetical protein